MSSNNSKVRRQIDIPVTNKYILNRLEQCLLSLRVRRTHQRRPELHSDEAAGEEPGDSKEGPRQKVYSRHSYKLFGKYLIS
jgi:hypothetical protein